MVYRSIGRSTCADASTSSRWGGGALLVALAIAACASPPSAATEAAPDARFVPGELLVRFDRQADAAERASAMSEVDAETRERLFVPGLRLVEINGSSVPSAAAELAAQPGVRYAEPNFIDEFSAAPNDPGFGLQWALHNTGQDVNGGDPGGAGTPDADIDAPAAWDLTRGSGSVIVGIADTGVDYNHPDLAPNIYRNPGETGGGKETNGVDDDGNGRIDDTHGWDFFGNDNVPLPSGAAGSNHGTLVAGSAGAQGSNSLGMTGASQEVALMPLRVGDTNSSIALLVQAFGYASGLGADVINLSASGPTLSQALLDAIRAAPNTLFVFSAGNGGADNIGDNNDISPIYPCSHNEPNVICVAATTQTDARASFSNYGPGTVDLAAPGVRILATNVGTGYSLVNGTSFAAPITAGAAALIRARYPNESLARLRTRLLEGVDPKGLPVTTGGRLNVNNSLRLGLPLPDSSPPDTSIITGPKPKVKTRKRRKKGRFEFVSSEPASTFQCSIDGAGEPCTSPFVRKVRKGRHLFQVRAIDRAGNPDATPATHAWKLKRKKKKP
jgi:subtilisin family serine protease